MKRRRERNLPFLCACMLLVVLALAPVGCTTTVVTVTKPDGTVIRAERYRLGNDESVDELVVPTPSGNASLRGFKSDSKLAEAAADLAATAKNLSAAATKTPP